MSNLSGIEWTQDALVGGHPALDFVNTTGGRSRARTGDGLTDYGVFLRWAQAAGLLSDAEVSLLTARFEASAAEARRTLTRARNFREALHVCLVAEQARAPWPKVSADLVAETLHDALWIARLDRFQKAYRWRISLANAGMALPVLRAALAAEALLRQDDLARMRLCDRCSWLFIDRGRGRPRRWCRMSACGSREKSARYYRRRTGRDG